MNTPKQLTVGPIKGNEISNSLISLFERRYLSNFDIRQWQVEQSTNEDRGIVLKKITEIGRIQEREDIRAVLPNILHACHSEGHALIMMLNGLGTHQEVYLGGKRMVGKANASTIGYINGVESAFKTYYAGLKMSASASLESLSNIDDFIANAPVMRAITGIPSNKEAAKTFNIQSLDRLARAAGNYKYSLMVVAEPINASEVDKIADHLRDLKGEVHSLKRKNTTEQRGTTTSVSVSKQDIDLDKQFKLQALSIIGNALIFVGSAFPPAALGGAGLSIYTNRKLTRLQADTTTTTKQSGTNESFSVSYEQLDAHAEFCEKLIDEHLNRLLAAKSNGWWQMAMYVAAENEETLGGVVGAIKSICSGDNSSLDPIRALEIPNAVLRKHILEGSIIKAYPNNNNNVSHPLGESYNSFSTCVNSKELSTVVHLPINEIPGIRFINHAEFSQNPPKKVDASGSIDVGSIEKNGDNLFDISIGLRSLNRHLFISGMTGGGKSNTCLQILYDLYSKHKIPFMVIDPVKSDYTPLLSVAELKPVFKIFSIGVSSDLPLRINPFELLSWEVCRRFPKFLSKHIEYLKAIFTASLPDLKGGPSVSIIEEALTLVYKSKGWNINYSTNKWLMERVEPSEEEWYAVMPNMDDFWKSLKKVIDNKQYKEDTLRDLREALLTRFLSLTAVNKGAIFNCSKSVSFDILFDQPSLVELKDLADDDDKSLVMAILFTFLYEYSEYVRGKSEQLKHMTVIEEAHRLLSAPKYMQDAGNPHAKLVETFSQMIAEMRGLGEGFIIADQSPQALSRNIIRNTNIKIVHRLTDETDRAICGGSINLTREQINYLNNLEPGYAVIHDDTFEEPVLIKVRNFKNTKLETWNNNTEVRSLQVMAESLKKADDSFLLRKNACKGCTKPCTFYYESDFEDVRIASKNSGKLPDTTDYTFVKKFADGILFEQFDQAQYAVATWRNKSTDSKDLLFCKGVYYLEKWLDDWIFEQKITTTIKIGEVLKDKIHAFFAKTLLTFLLNEPLKMESLNTLYTFKEWFKTPQKLSNPGVCQKCQYSCILIPTVKSLSNENAFKQFSNRDKYVNAPQVYEKYTQDFVSILPVPTNEFAEQVLNCSKIP